MNITGLVSQPTLSYTPDLPRAYGEPAGIRLLVALEAAGRDPFPTDHATETARALGLGSGHTSKLLHQLARGGWLIRIKKGLYALADPITGQPRAHPFAIGTAIVVPSAVSHWSALHHWGLTEQIPNTVTVSSPVRTFPSESHPDEAMPRPTWVVAGVRYEFVALTRERFFGGSEVWISERNRVTIFDRERALLDAFHHFHIFGSLSVGLEILQAHLDDLDLERLVAYARQLGIVAAVKRVGWALERFGVAPAILAPLRTYPAKGDSPLDPGRPPHGHHNPVWNVIENLADEQ